MTEQERRESERSNYYLILELDFRKPEVSKDVIKKKFDSKCAEWSSLLNNPQKRREAQNNQDVTGKSGSFERIMLAEDMNSLERLEEAKAALVISEKKLQELVNSFCGIKTVKASGLKKYIENNKKYMLSFDTIKEKMKVAGVTIEEDKGTGRNLFEEVIKDLDVVGKKTLYDFLFWAVDDSKNNIKKPGGGKWKSEDIYNFSQDEIKEISDKIYARYNAIAQKTERNNAVKKLATQCKKILTDAKTRKQYDDFISKMIPEAVSDRIDLFALDSAISLEKARDLIELYGNTPEGRKLSVSEIKQSLKREFIARKITDYEFPNDTVDSPTFRRCKICGYLVEYGNKHCSNCGNSFMIKCFSCGKEVENGVQNCPYCGTDLGGKINAEKECNAAQKCLDRFDFDGALECVKGAKRYWKEYAAIAPLEAEIQMKRSQLESNINHIKQLAAQKKFVEAKNEYYILSTRVRSYQDDALIENINSSIAEATEWFHKAKASDNESQIIDFCLKALEVCADMQYAKLLMVKYPPKPATDLRVIKKDKSNLITWNKSPSVGNVTYRLMKREGSVPTSDMEDEQNICLAEISANQFEDTNLSANTPTYYSVYTYRAGISALPAFNKEAVMNFLDVDSCTVEEGNACITLRWEKKQIVDKVEVYRKEGAPVAKYGEGEKLKIFSSNSLTDLNLVNDRTYYYTIYAIYQTVNGFVPSSGITVKATPALPPEKVVNRELIKKGNSYIFTWEPVHIGHVEVMMSRQEPAVSSGTMISLEEIKHMFEVLPVEAKAASSIQFHVPEEGVFYICPISVVNQMGVIGDCQRISNVADFSGMQQPRISGNTIYLSFDWTCQAREAAILYKIGEYPSGPEDSMASRIVISKEAYEKEKIISIHDITKNDYYFTVYAAYGDGIYSSGISTFYLNGEQGTIYYEIEVEKTLFQKIKGIKVMISCENIDAIPKMILYKKAGVQPVDKGDGILVGTIESTSQKKLEVKFPDTMINERTKFQLFFEDAALYSKLQLRKR
ncbi:MAG: zinc ribbon domain-containing protein [Lachnospiraceae bacterium]|nr:zinc ribbon domain-containing protein [Lachnospiraceae bacterium]